MRTLNQTTGMVSEFYVLSVLLRCGINANLTLGNQQKFLPSLKKEKKM